jgi:hypothetical protein
MRGGARRLLVPAVVAVLLLGAAGHLARWYLPRERPAAPDPGDLPGRLLAGDAYDLCLWLPYPHQNLGLLARAVDDPQDYLTAAAEALGMPPPVVPGFGPFRVPPARELAVAVRADGGGAVVAARIYPLVAAAARLAGKLAANPWLAGGEVQLAGRPARVRWEGTLWVVESGTGAAPPAAGTPPPAANPSPALGWLRVSRAAGWVPPGSYRLARGGEGLSLAPPGGGAAAVDLPDLGGTGVVALVAAAAGSAIAPPGGGGAALLFAGEGRLGLPGAAVLFAAGGGRWKLPGEGVLGLLGHLPAGEGGGWKVVALDRESLAAALRLAPGVGRLEDGSWAVAVAPGPAYDLTDRVASVLEEVPLLGRAQARRWRAWARLLAPLRRYRLLTLEVGRREGQLRLSLR